MSEQNNHTMQWPDGRQRCRWCNPQNPLYIAYHDAEWGVPCHDDHRLFEMLILEGFQAGLSWECVLNKRDGFWQAFDGFDAPVIARYPDEKLEALRHDSRIIRNKLKIRAARTNARVFLAIREEWGSFDAYLWHWTDGKVVYERDCTRSLLSDQISADLKKRGMTFVGTTIIYAYLQAMGVICSHDEGCWKQVQLAEDSPI